MSTIYKWQDSENVVTSTTTASLLKASDPVLVNSQNLGGRAAQATVGSIATLWPVASIATTATTATALLPYGIVSVTSSSTANPATWLLSTATQIGQCVTLIYNCTSTSSQNTVTTASTVNMTMAATETYAGISITFSAPKAYVELTAVTVSTALGGFINPTVWMVTGRSAAGTVCS